MTATLHGQTGATGVTSASILDFDVIKERAAKILELESAREVTDIALGDLFGLTRETIWRFRAGAMKPSLPTALAMAQKLGLSVEEITAGATQPKPASPAPQTPPRPAAPGSPPRPQGPKGK